MISSPNQVRSSSSRRSNSSQHLCPRCFRLPSRDISISCQTFQSQYQIFSNYTIIKLITWWCVKNFILVCSAFKMRRLHSKYNGEKNKTTKTSFYYNFLCVAYSCYWIYRYSQPWHWLRWLREFRLRAAKNQRPCFVFNEPSSQSKITKNRCWLMRCFKELI